MPIFDEYDFVIVGSSPSGLIVASRLTENANVTVLILEAGVEETIYNDIPAMATVLLFSEYNWKFRSEYNANVCRAMDDEICPWPSGRGLGGATLINGMIYTRGNRKDFDKWEAMGNPGWAYDDLVKYFTKHEDTRITEIQNSKFHGTNGNLTISYPNFHSEVADRFILAGEELGLRLTDYNSPGNHIGVSKIQSTMREGARCSAATAFIKPIKHRSNLHISQLSRVIKIIIDPTTNRALGVLFIKNGRRRFVKARREVILSAGAFNTPQLLMLSGIGHAEHLAQMGIPVYMDLPVGDNLQEHIGTTSLTFTLDRWIVPRFKTEQWLIPFTFLDWLTTGNSLLSSVGCESLAYVKSSYAEDGDSPDIELIEVAASYASDRGTVLRRNYGIREDIYNAVYKELEDTPSFSIWVMGMYPKSRGKIRLASPNPFIQPRIINNFLSDRQDLDVLIEGIKWAIKFIETKAFADVGAKLYNKPLPNCIDFTFASDDYWECFIREITSQYHHQCCTARMGPQWDHKAVVDYRLRVYGIQSLRIVDASIMPDIPGGHTMAATYMIGEKASDLIKEDYGI
ncbi:hypothetical protein O3M35_012912 [Rhynocoris fuscipes]|uniref:Glucose-methanol-choline oxidoreductase N-terminal domain-containing protein n=1 Tax=Rhynocoris fuscipes TaxID=488301 RepID=A0AAW1CKV2_9HEMI